LKEKEGFSEFYNTKAHEKVLWKLKSRVSWLRVGKNNTKFFKLTTLQRRNFNYISIKILEDHTIVDPIEIKIEGMKFYEALLGIDHEEDEVSMEDIL